MIYNPGTFCLWRQKCEGKKNTLTLLTYGGRPNLLACYKLANPMPLLFGSCCCKPDQCTVAQVNTIARIWAPWPPKSARERYREIGTLMAIERLARQVNCLLYDFKQLCLNGMVVRLSEQASSTTTHTQILFFKNYCFSDRLG